MRVKLLSACLFAAISCQPVFAKSESFIAKIEDIRANRSALDENQESIRAERIFIVGDNPCNDVYFHVNANSLALSPKKYQEFIMDVWQQAQKERYFRFTTTACNETSSQMATKIEACNEKICDAKFVIDDSIIWLHGTIGDLQVLNRNDAIDIGEFFIRLPLDFDKEKKLWKVTGWYLGNDLDTSGEGKHKAFEGYTDTEDFSSQKFIADFTTYYKSGERAAEISFNQQGLRDGKFNSWHKNGKIDQKIKFFDGKIDGESIQFNDNGTVANKSVFNSGVHADGSCNHYDGNGNVLREHSYLDGKYEGKYVDYYSAGKPELESFYKNGVVVGEKKEYFENGKIKSLSHFDEQGEIDGIQETYAESGKLISRVVYKNTQPVSTERWYVTGKEKYLEQYDENRKKHGDMKEWAENGELIHHVKFNRGDITSERKWTDKGAPLYEVVYEDDSKINIKRTWSEETGKLTQESHYDDYTLSGVTKRWDEKTGRLILETNYKNGAEEGLRKNYDPQTGVLIMESWNEGYSFVKHFVNNQPSMRKYKNGKLITAGCDATKLLDNPEEVKKQAESGDANSQVQLGYYFDGCSKYKEAESWMLKSADQKNSDALYYLAQIYLSGKKDEIAEDMPKFRKFLMEAAEAGNMDAQNSVGNRLLPEEVCRHILSSCDAKYRYPISDIDKALYWLDKAAEQGDIGALSSLGKIYGYGIGVPEYTEKARQYYLDLEKVAPEFARTQINEFNAYNASKNKGS
ncbi:hypothetical protein [Serratia fonticola]